MGEFSAAGRNLTTQLVDLSTVPYGRPLQLVTPGTPVYMVMLRRVFGRFFNTVQLQFGNGQPIALGGIGDRFGFATEMVEGITLLNALPVFSIVAANTAPARNFMEFLFAHAPGIGFDSDLTDPLDLAPFYSGSLESPGVPPDFSYVELQNSFNPAAPTSLLTWLQCRRLIISSTIDQAVVVTDNFAAPVGVTAGQPRVVPDIGGPPIGTPGQGMLTAFHAGAIAGGELARFRVRAGEALTLPFLQDLPPSQTNAQANAMRVWGATAGQTIDVTYEWCEEWIRSH